MVLQETDPGVVTTGCSVWCSSGALFQSINQFQILQSRSETVHIAKDSVVTSELTSNKVDTAALSSRKRQVRKSLQYHCHAVSPGLSLLWEIGIAALPIFVDAEQEA